MRAAFTHSAVSQLVPFDRELIMTRGGITRISDVRQLRLRVEQGPVWVTLAGRHDDVVLETGQTLFIPSGTLTLVSTCGSRSLAQVRIEPAPQSGLRPCSGLAARIRSWWTALLFPK